MTDHDPDVDSAFRRGYEARCAELDAFQSGWNAGSQNGSAELSDADERRNGIRAEALDLAVSRFVQIDAMPNGEPERVAFVDIYARAAFQLADRFVEYLTPSTGDETPTDDYDLAPRDANPHKVEYTGVRINPDGAVMLSRSKADGTVTVWPLGRIMPGEVRVERAAEMVNAMGYDRVGPWSEFSSNGPQLAQVSPRRPAS
jgi:hypothetical protein